jgi:hypothetical protein
LPDRDFHPVRDIEFPLALVNVEFHTEVRPKTYCEIDESVVQIM